MSKISWMTPVVTVFHEDGTLDVEGNKAVYEHLIKGGVDGNTFFEIFSVFYIFSFSLSF